MREGRVYRWITGGQVSSKHDSTARYLVTTLRTTSTNSASIPPRHNVMKCIM